MKISITGVTGFRNRGVEALVVPIVQQLRSVFPKSELTVCSDSADYDRSRPLPGDVKIVGSGKTDPSYSRKRRIAMRLGIDAGPGVYRGWEPLRRSDLVIVTGGDCFSSEYGDAAFDRHLVPLRIAASRGIPYIFLAQSIGPFTSDLHRSSFLEVARGAAAISVREDRTQRYLVDELGLEAARVPRVADPAFLLEPSDRIPDAVRRRTDDETPVVAISVSDGIAAWSGMDCGGRIRVWAELITRIRRQWGAHVLLVPHVQERNRNDTYACTDVWRALSFCEGVEVLGADFSASEFKGIISRCDLVVAERMHAGIAGLSSGVCTSIVAYSVKARGVIDEMLSPFAKRGALLEATDFEHPDAVWSQLEMLWSAREEAAAHLRLKLEETKAKATEAFTMIPEILSDRVAAEGT